MQGRQVRPGPLLSGLDSRQQGEQGADCPSLMFLPSLPSGEPMLRKQVPKMFANPAYHRTITRDDVRQPTVPRKALRAKLHCIIFMRNPCTPTPLNITHISASVNEPFMSAFPQHLRSVWRLGGAQHTYTTQCPGLSPLLGLHFHADSAPFQRIQDFQEIICSTFRDLGLCCFVYMPRDPI